ncbi:unnamed protein product [Somion occarium]|uniref:t-SNARE coiled-coil homology domain-containing protein n=1 Tax=Somion occarium TaxID=3059160 RepID=A0ABP1CNX2_9APHY
MDTSPTSLFDSYEQDFQQIVSSIRDKLEGDAKGDVAEQRKAALRRVEMELDEADEMVSQMEIEIQGIPQSLRPSYQSRIRSAKADLQRYKKQSKDLHAQAARSDLLSRPGMGGLPSSDDPYGPSSDRTRLLAGTALLEDGSRRLMDSQRVALETEEQGADILRSLRGQREQIQNARDTLSRADTSIGRASGTLKRMIRRSVPRSNCLTPFIPNLTGGYDTSQNVPTARRHSCHRRRSRSSDRHYPLGQASLMMTRSSSHLPDTAIMSSRDSHRTRPECALIGLSLFSHTCTGTLLYLWISPVLAPIQLFKCK